VRFAEGDIVRRKRRAPVCESDRIGLVIEADACDGTVKLLFFDACGPHTHRLSEALAERFFEIVK
jgi:hypothetical protein